MKIKPSFFNFGGEIGVCLTYQIDDKPARVCIRRVRDQYELYARTYGPSQSAVEMVITRGSLETVVDGSNALMREHFGPDWEADVIVPEDLS
ncbi:MAG: hypothetical protein LUO93_08765 [Methanomicrobiales archaeon]|nr:hypothetical protein [Methanomicrobiales archaeon]